MFHCCSCGGGTRTTRPPGYEPGELPLLYPAIYIKTENVFFDYLIPQIKSIKIAVRFLTLQIYKLYLTIPNF